MSICKVCQKNGKDGVQITFSDKIRSQYSQKMIPLETDGSTYHKHYEPSKPIPESNDYPNPITLPANGNGNRYTNITNQAQNPKSRENIFAKQGQIDLNNLNVIRVLVAALQDYIAMKEAGK